MQAIRDIHQLDIRVEEKYDKIICILPELEDNYWFGNEYINRNSLDIAICCTIYAKEYLSEYDLEYLLEFVVLYNNIIIYEVIYQKSEDKIATYNLLISKIYDRQFLHYEFISCAICENNKQVYTEIITNSNGMIHKILYVGEGETRSAPISHIDTLKHVISTAYQSNNKEFVRWFLEYTGYEAGEVLKGFKIQNVKINVFLIRILAESNNIDDLVKYKLTPRSHVFQSFMIAGASREVLYEVYGDSLEFQEWIRIEDV